MYYMPRSIWYGLEYSFCQTDTKLKDAANNKVDDAVLAAHGICTVAAANWLDGKMNGQAFVFSAQTVAEKARNINAAGGTQRGMYAAAMPSRTVSLPSPNHDLDRGGNNALVAAAVVAALTANPQLILHLQGSDGAHALAMCTVGGKHYMFDSNFGSFKCSYEKGVSSWFLNNISCNRPTRGRYLDWANYMQIYRIT